MLLFKIYFILFLSVPILLSAHSPSQDDKHIETSLRLFEKAIHMSPELLPKRDSNLSPFYKVHGHKIYLNQAFWKLTQAWMELYIQEISKDCPCDLDIPTVMEEGKKYYLPKNPAFAEASRFTHKITERSGVLISYFTAKYGYTAATLKVAAEIAETFLSLFVGGKGIHVLCTVSDAMIFPIAKKTQRAFNIFSHGSKFSKSSLLFSAKMAWLSRRINKSQKRVFFIIDQALEFQSEKLQTLNTKGPKSLFHSKGHRLLWLTKLEKKTQGLFDQIQVLKEELAYEKNPKTKEKIEKKINILQEKIHKLSQINRKEFFGKRFKRYLFLKSRKSKTAYMNSSDIQKPFGFMMKKDFWPLGMQYLFHHSIDNNISDSKLRADKQKPETFLSHKEHLAINQKYSDEILSGLIEEFLNSLGKENSQINKKSIEFFLSDFHNIFDEKQKPELRLMSARSVELLLSHFFSHYLNLSKQKIINDHPMSFKEKTSLYWHFGRTENLAGGFVDFLLSVAITKQANKIQFYKYESIEKFFAFLKYFHEVSLFLKEDGLEVKDFFKKLNHKQNHIQSLSLAHEKNIAVQFIPLKKRFPKCKQIVEKYQ